MPERNRYGALAEAIAENRNGGVGGFFRGVGNGIRNTFNATPIGHAVHGDWLGAFNATPIGMAIAALRGGNPVGPNNSRAYFNSLANPTGMNAFGPTTGGYGSGAGASGAAPWTQTDWGAASGGAPSTGGNIPTLPTTTVTAQAPAYMGAAQSMGAASGLGGNQAGGLGRLMTNTIPWRQSGTTFVDRQQEF